MRAESLLLGTTTVGPWESWEMQERRGGGRYTMDGGTGKGEMEEGRWRLMFLALPILSGEGWGAYTYWYLIGLAGYVGEKANFWALGLGGGATAGG